MYLQHVLLATLAYALRPLQATGTNVSTQDTRLSGLIPFQYQGESYHTYFEAFGSVHSLENRPLLVLHGGPGLTLDYMLPLADLASSRFVILYDQIGSARSSHPDSKPTSFWVPELFLAEMENVIDHFGIGSNMDLLGHSWGGMMAAQWALSNPRGLKNLILTDTLPAMSLWDQSQEELASTYPESVIEGLEAGFSDPVAYRAALDIFFADHGCILKPTPKDINISFDYSFADPTSAIATDTTLADWDIISQLHQIRNPTLVINGAADIAQDFVIQPFLDNIAGSIHYKFQNASHTPFWERRADYMSVVVEFLSNGTVQA